MTLATPVKLVPIKFSADGKSIGGADLCATCTKCSYQPGTMSGCEAGWPGLEDAFGYVLECDSMVSTKDACKTFLNPAQICCLQFYAGGDFDHLREIASEDLFKLNIRNCGDTLLTFLMFELATSEDCDSIETAKSRTANAIEDLYAVLGNLEKLSDTIPAWGE